MNTNRYTRWAEPMILLLGRFSLASVFWLSGQTKITGFSLNLIHGNIQFGWPQLKATTLYLFEHEYQLPLIPYQWAAYMATIGEHLFPLLILSGLATRFAAAGLLMMTLVIQLLVYPDAYSTHLTWMTICLLLIFRGAGSISADALIQQSIFRHKKSRA